MRSREDFGFGKRLTRTATLTLAMALPFAQEVADRRSDLLRAGLEREVARLEEPDNRPGNIAPERLGAARQEKGVVLSPHRQEARLVSPEVVLERRIERDIVLVVAE